MTEMDHDERYQIIERHVAMLREHFDSVQILASRTEDGGTARFEYGSGSWYERLGLTRSLVIRWEEQERVAEREAGE
ncbi:MAG: hypothetical protein OEX05_11220 [Chloroflexota bacterium]|nr:hypothetical protein [Chloroflexota bacterium]